MKFGRIVSHVNTRRLMDQILDLTSHFQNDDHDVFPLLAAAYAAASAGCLLAHRAHVMPLGRCSVCATVPDPYYVLVDS